MLNFDERAAARTTLLLDACHAANYFITGDFRVTETVAAALLGVATGTLRRWRLEGNAPMHITAGGRIWYALGDLAEWIELGRGSLSDGATTGRKNHTSNDATFDSDDDARKHDQRCDVFTGEVADQSNTNGIEPAHETPNDYSAERRKLAG